MIWNGIAGGVEFVVDMFAVRWTSAGKDLEILLLRQQLRVLERKLGQQALPSLCDRALYALTNGGTSGFVAKISPAGDALVYSTFWRGSIRAIAIDKANDVYLTGNIGSGDLPVKDAIQATNNGNNAFITELNPNGDAAIFSTFLGGNGGEIGTALALDSSDNIYVAGNSFSTNFPVKNSIPGTKSIPQSAFFAKISVGTSTDVSVPVTPSAAPVNASSADGIDLSIVSDSPLALLGDTVTFSG